MMKNILYIVDADVTKSSFGSEQRTHLLYEALQNIGNVYVVQVSEKDECVDSKYWRLRIENRNGICRIVNSVWCRIIHLLCPYRVIAYYPFPLHFDIEKVYPNVRFDAVVVRYLHHVGSLHLWNIAPLYVDVDDHPLQVFETTYRNKFGAFRLIMGRCIHRLLIRLSLRKATGVWISNPEQYPLISQYNNPCVLHNIPMIDVTSVCNKTTGKEGYLFTIGIMLYRPNYEGVDLFVRDIWPQVRKRYPQLEYIIAGEGAPEELAEKWSHVDGVRVAGFVEDLQDLYANSFATVVPIVSGGGTCIKTLESLAMGRLCFATTFGARGISKDDIDKNGLGLLVYNSAEDFLGLLDKAMNDADWRNSREFNGVRFIKENYSYDSFVMDVKKGLERQRLSRIQTQFSKNS